MSSDDERESVYLDCVEDSGGDSDAKVQVDEVDQEGSGSERKRGPGRYPAKRPPDQPSPAQPAPRRQQLTNNPPPTTPPAQTSPPSPRSRSRDASSTPRNRFSIPGPIPVVPAIPARFLTNAQPASVSELAKRQESQAATHALLVKTDPSPSLHVQRPSNDLSGGGAQEQSHLRELKAVRRRSLPASSALVNGSALEKLEHSAEAGKRKPANMDRPSKGGRAEDLFLELANDQVGAEQTTAPTRRNRASSRLSLSEKRHSMPAEDLLNSSAERRPGSSGRNGGGLASRMNATSDLQRQSERYRMTSQRATFQADDAASNSGRTHTSHAHRYSIAPDRSPLVPSRLAERIRSPELPHYGRRRPSFESTQGPSQQPGANHASSASKNQGSFESSPAEQSNEDTTSTESQTPDTVWDELDDLKSRIKNLELNGKLPTGTGQTASNEQGDRPRTATTAPTTIDSSPKREKQEQKPTSSDAPHAESPSESKGSQLDSNNIHPLLHSSLAKAKQLLNPGLYRTLEATAADAVQLAAMTGSAGPQGTTFSAASIINGVTVSDRHVRRKADTMCRNLTDLAIALCDGKKDGPSAVASPATYEAPTLKSSPTIRYSRGSLGSTESLNHARPMSRLEAHRSSILGSQREAAAQPLPPSPRTYTTERQSSPVDFTPPSKSHFQTSHLNLPSQRRSSRASLHVSPKSHPYAESATSADDNDPTVRPVSRAMTDIGASSSALRHKTNSSVPASSSSTSTAGPRDYHTPPQRSPSLRESLVARRHAHATNPPPGSGPGAPGNAAAFEHNRDLSRRASLAADVGGPRRRFMDSPATPSVAEESGGEEMQGREGEMSQGREKRRVLSFGHFGGRRGVGVRRGE